jgi:outer membrane protein assembly factor BamD
MLLMAGAGCRRHPYKNRIVKDTQQPDKMLYDQAIKDIEKGRYERARLTLQTLMNTYDSSEFLAKSKIALADSWYREGGITGLAQAEAEYKDFILFYPTMEEAAEAQTRVCQIEFDQMDKSDRDPQHALKAEEECRQVLAQFPNSKHAPTAQQRLREIQEVLAQAEYNVGVFYFNKGTFPAAANRLQGLSDQFPLFSQNDEALWQLGSAYRRMGDRFEDKQAAAYTRIVRDYPLSSRVEEAKQRLQELNRPVPEADASAAARMKFERENSTPRGALGKTLGMFSSHPDVRTAAKSGSPQMTSLQPTVPASVPTEAALAEQLKTAATGEVSATIPGDTSQPSGPDAKVATPAVSGGGSKPASTKKPAAKSKKKPDSKKSEPAADSSTTGK